MGVREEQKEKRRLEILEAALFLFIRKGYSATKIADIAEQADMSTGLMFHYFESKEKLYEELIKFGVSGPMSIMSMQSSEPIVFFEQAASQIFNFVKSDHFTANMFVLMNQAFYDDAAPESVKQLLSGFDIYTPTAALIEKGQQDGSIRDGDPMALTFAFWCAIQGIAEQLALHPNSPCPESEWVVDILRRKES